MRTWNRFILWVFPLVIQQPVVCPVERRAVGGVTVCAYICMYTTNGLFILKMYSMFAFCLSRDYFIISQQSTAEKFGYARRRVGCMHIGIYMQRF